MSVKSYLKKNKTILSLFYSYQALKEFFIFNFWEFGSNVIWFLKDLRSFRKQNKSHKKVYDDFVLMPLLKDRTESTPVDPIYFFQDSWAAKKIFELKPEHHFDIGSSAKTIGIISQFVPTTMIDIRPLPLKIDNLFFKKGSILNLPFEDNSIKSISSLCVIEHIGLGRYGDPIDIYGSEKAIKELLRVTAHGGTILFSVPVFQTNKIFFNAHRVFRTDYIMEQFNSCELIEAKYILGNDLYDSFSISDEFQVGLFYFRKK
jgi:SAM-dependent methyltransferase